MTEFTSILSALTFDKFSEIFEASPRQSREAYFNRHGVKVKTSGTRFNKPGAKKVAKTRALFERLAENIDDEMSEEILRAWLLSKRPLLEGALDHLGIEHKNGLTESEDLDAKIEGLSATEIQAMVKALDGRATVDDIRVYLKFLGAKDVDAALN